MLRRDYIMKLIQQLIESLFLLLNKKDIDDDARKAQLDSFYKDYLGESQDYYINASLDDIVAHLENKYGQEEIVYRVEMLSEIMYQDGMLEEDKPLKIMKLLQTLALLNYLEESSNTYSIVRNGKIDEIKSLI